jgi:hypothetical protein
MGRLLALGILGSCACAALASNALAQSTGSITGTITTGAKGLAPVRVTIDQKICGPELPDDAVVVDAQGRLANAVVILTGVKRAAPADSAVSNEKCRFAPRVQIARPNGNVRTTSRDPILHTTNAMLENGRTIFNVALPIAGLNITRPIGGAGIVRLGCNTHPWMRGWMIVTDEAAVVTGADGRFSLDNIPAGSYELRVWHESLKAASQRITITSGKPADVAVHMK